MNRDYQLYKIKNNLNNKENGNYKNAVAMEIIIIKLISKYLKIQNKELLISKRFKDKRKIFEVDVFALKGIGNISFL